LGSRVARSLESTVGNIGTVIEHVGHSGLVHGTVPSDVSGFTESVSVHVLVVLMVDGGLSGSPFAVCIRNWGVLGQDTADIPEEEVGVVDQGFGVHGIVIQADGSLLGESTAQSSDDEEDNPGVSDSASDMEILDGELTDDSETEEDSQLSATTVVGPVEVGTVDGAGDFVHGSSGEPGFKLSQNDGYKISNYTYDVKVLHSLISPDRLGLLDNMIGHTETDELSILNVLRNLGVKTTSHSIIIGVLKNKTVRSIE
jgi:hypothetical protein